VKHWTRDLPGQKIWFVGASSGIGAATARLLTERGARVAISGRRRDLLTQVAGDRMVVAPLDVTDREAVRRVASEVADALGGIDVVVWCAAYWKQSDATQWDADAFARHYEVNVLGFNNVVDATLPAMLERGRGHLAGVASVAGFRGFPGAEGYGSTKAALVALLESLRASLWTRGVRVTTIAPGFVRTELTAVNQFPMPFLIDLDQAAASIVRGIERGRLEIVFPWRIATLMKLARFVPVRWWAARFGRDIAKERSSSANHRT
jgi:NADP-dependent 3-hydroxy acid dehydrogenase YdfG